MRHILVSSMEPGLAERLRLAAPASAEVLSTGGVEETLERLARAARVDAVVTDDREVVAAIRGEIPGNFPIVLAEPAMSAGDIWALVDDSR